MGTGRSARRRYRPPPRRARCCGPSRARGTGCGCRRRSIPGGWRRSPGWWRRRSRPGGWRLCLRRRRCWCGAKRRAWRRDGRKPPPQPSPVLTHGRVGEGALTSSTTSSGACRPPLRRSPPPSITGRSACGWPRISVSPCPAPGWWSRSRTSRRSSPAPGLPGAGWSRRRCPRPAGTGTSNAAAPAWRSRRRAARSRGCSAGSAPSFSSPGWSARRTSAASPCSCRTASCASPASTASSWTGAAGSSASSWPCGPPVSRG